MSGYVQAAGENVVSCTGQVAVGEGPYETDRRPLGRLRQSLCLEPNLQRREDLPRLFIGAAQRGRRRDSWGETSPV
jgi:hypothetical protein